MPDTYPYTRPILPRLSFLIRSVVPLAVALTGCATAPRRSPLPEVANEVPPEVKTRLFGRWTCGSELPRGPRLAAGGPGEAGREWHAAPAGRHRRRILPAHGGHGLVHDRAVRAAARAGAAAQRRGGGGPVVERDGSPHHRRAWRSLAVAG